VQIKLDDLFPGHGSGIAYIYADGQAVLIVELGGGDLKITILERGVAEAMAKWEQDRHIFGLIIAIADEEALAVTYLGVAGEIEIGGGIGHFTREGLGQFAAGVDQAKENIGNGPAAGLSHRPGPVPGHKASLNPR